jgi:hypothetical protein
MIDREPYETLFAAWEAFPLNRSEPGDVKHVAVRAGRPSYAVPSLISGHQPDVLILRQSLPTLIGVIRTGPDLASEDSRVGLRAFCHHRDSQGPAAVCLCVPTGYQAEAEAALLAAGGRVPSLVITSHVSQGDTDATLTGAGSGTAPFRSEA